MRNQRLRDLNDYSLFTNKRFTNKRHSSDRIRTGFMACQPGQRQDDNDHFVIQSFMALLSGFVVIFAEDGIKLALDGHS